MTFALPAALTATRGHDNVLGVMQPPPPKIILLKPQKPDEMRFKQAGCELIVTYYRELSPEEKGLVRETVYKQLDQRRLAANTQLQLKQGDFQVALKLLVDSLDRLSAP